MDDVNKAIALIDEEEAIGLLRSLVQVNSVTNIGNERAVSEAIQAHLQGVGVKLQPQLLSETRENLIVAYDDANADSQKTLVFSGHFDTVPPGNVAWKHPVFNGNIVENKMVGRGTADMKSGVAAMVLAIEYIAKAGLALKGKLRFVGTVGEEVDCFGAKQVVANRLIDDATAMVIGEPTGNQVKIAHKGVLWFKVSMFGKTAHGSMPSLGVNAIMGMNEFLSALKDYSLSYERHEILGDSTMNVGMIQGGVGTNVVPDRCTVHLDIRTVPGQSHAEIEQDMKDLLDSVTAGTALTYQLEVINDLISVHTSVEDRFIQLAQDTDATLFHRDGSPGGLHYYTDGSIYQQAQPQVPILIYGPGEAQQAHQPDESVDLQQFLDSIKFYIKLAVDYLR